VPSFLAAAGATADPAYALDGVDIRPALSGGSLPQRALFWRYKNQAQEAMRLGDWKYLKIAGNSFLFNLAGDPMERANLKTIQPERFAAMQQAWADWSHTMLPLDPASTSHILTGADVADRYGVGP